MSGEAVDPGTSLARYATSFHVAIGLSQGKGQPKTVCYSATGVNSVRFSYQQHHLFANCITCATPAVPLNIDVSFVGME